MILSLLLAGTMATVEQHDAIYTFRVDPEHPRVAQVSATLRSTNDGYCLRRYAQDTGLQHGWATFVHQLQATDQEQRPVPLAYDGQGCWRGTGNQRLNLSYQMLLQHDRFPNLPGDDELAYAGDWGQFWTSRALFIEGDLSQAIAVRFDLPDDWTVSAPWPQGHEANLFLPGDSDELLDSALMLGTHWRNTKRLGDVHIEIGLAGNTAVAQSDAVESALDYALAHFGDLHSAPPSGRLALFLGEGRHYGGGVMGRSISMLIAGDLPPQMRSMLDYIITHEVFHLWNSDLNYADASAMYWFAEGFAEYYTHLALHRAGQLGAEQLQQMYSERAKRYQQAHAASALSLQDAGTQKLDHYDLIYSGGLMVALAMDRRIAQLSGGQQHLAAILPALRRQFGANSERTLDAAALAALVRTETGVDVADLLERHVVGRELLDTRELLGDAATSLLSP